jgi:hypothetical protein
MWVNLTPAEQVALRELDDLSDRAAAIVGATILEARLEERLRHAMCNLTIRSGQTLHDRMFNNSGALATFSGRINIAYMCGIYNESVWRDLNLIRDLRNDFAHQTEIGSFEDQSVAARSANLKACDVHFQNAQAGDRIMAVEETDDGLTFTFAIRDLESQLKDARRRYLLCVMYYTMLLKYPLVEKWQPHFDLPTG